MLVRCPKCSFSQPQDQYCAQCGIDMTTYKPKGNIWLTKFFGSIAFPITAVVILVLFFGQYYIKSDPNESWAQNISRFAGITKSTKQASQTTERGNGENSDPNQLQSQFVSAKMAANEEESTFAQNSLEGLADTGKLSSDQASSDSLVGANGDVNLTIFKVTYAEISLTNLQKWINTSQQTGQFQNLGDYSAGILNTTTGLTTDYKQILKTFDLKMTPGNSQNNLSGNINDESNQIIGLNTHIEYRSNQNDVFQGAINITKNNHQNSEFYPAEFELPKSSAFYIIGVLKPNNFAQDRTRLIAPPFNIFKSPDFMTRKTEFVIVVEPHYN